MNQLIYKFVSAAVLASVSGLTSAAAVLNDFKVNEAVIDGTGVAGLAENFTADKFTGTYVERFQVTGANTFTTTAFFKVGSFSKDDGANTVSPILLNAFEAIGGYQLYGIFTASGSFAQSGTTTSFTGANATFSLYADSNSDSGSGVAFGVGANNLNVVGTDFGMTDLLLAQSSTLVAGEGSFVPTSLAKGNFAILFGGLDGNGSPVADGLTALGKGYFYAPSPFYMVARTSGQFDTFVLPALGSTVEFTGSLDVTFANQIPEPTSLALAGIALAGLGFSRRKVR